MVTRNSRLRKPIEEIERQIKAAGYKWLSGKYQNNQSKLTLLCPKGHIYKVRQLSFQQGSRCFDCSYEVRATKTRKRFEDIKKAFGQKGYKVLTEKYQNNKQHLTIRCPKGHITDTMTWNNFQNGSGCSICAQKSTNFDLVRIYIESQKYRLISKEYNGTHSKDLIVECPKKHRYVVRWNDFQQGYRCPECREWKNEKRLGEILFQIFPTEKIETQDSLGFLGRQRVDYSIRGLKLAFEYDGEQHFRPVRFGGISKEEAQQNFAKQQKWDKTKNRLCQREGYQLIRIAYNENLNAKYIQKKVAQTKLKVENTNE